MLLKPPLIRCTKFEAYLIAGLRNPSSFAFFYKYAFLSASECQVRSIFLGKVPKADINVGQ